MSTKVEEYVRLEKNSSSNEKSVSLSDDVSAQAARNLNVVGQETRCKCDYCNNKIDLNNSEEGNSKNYKNGMLQKITDINSAIGTLYLAAGFFVAYFEYQSSLQKAEVEQTFRIIDQWESEKYMGRAEKFGRFVRNLEVEAIQELNAMNIEISDHLIFSFVSNEISKRLDSELSEDIDSLYYFFSKVSYCVSGKICDSKLIFDYFGETMLSFRAQTDAYVFEKRKTIRTFLREVDQFLKYK